MPNLRSPSSTDLLLELLEMTSLGAISADRIVRRLRRTYPFAGIARRAREGLETLAAEGLVESTVGDAGSLTYRATPSGLTTLERKGRFPGPAAVLFTDIVASTELIAEFGEAGAHRRRLQHFALLREQIAAHDGREVKNLGDGLMVIFADPAAAADCAAAMQSAVAGDRDRLGLRIGLHAGELLREGDDFFGTTVIVARRLCESAEAGQVVVSDEAFEAAGGDDPWPVRSLGTVDLKGLNRPVFASELLWSLERGGAGDAVEAPGDVAPVEIGVGR
jgi:class 3 adenylate cyclase